jgi:hypothetical protein
MIDTGLRTGPTRTPWHVWVVGILALLWNAGGAYTIMSAQAGTMPDLPKDELAYYAAQPLWFVAVTDVALVGGVLGAIALLMRSKWAVALFAVSLFAIVVTNGYDIGVGTSRMMTNTTTIVVTVTIWVLAVVQWWYATAMRKHGVLG